MGPLITLACRSCGRRAPYLRSNDPNLPAEVETLSHGKCDLCDDGDFSEEWMLDAAGNLIDPAKYGTDSPSEASAGTPATDAIHD